MSELKKAGDYKRVTVTLMIEKDSELYNRIQEYAEEEECSFKSAVEFIARLGINHHMLGNLDLLQRRQAPSVK